MPPDPLCLPILLEPTFHGQWILPNLPPEVCPEEHVVAHPQHLISAQTQGISWGAQMVFAPTGWCNRPLLAHYGKEDLVAELNRGLVAVTRQSAGAGAAVFGCLGPLPLTLRPFGHHRFETMVAEYATQVATLAPLVDGFSLEGMTTMAELRGAVLSIREVCDKPIWVTLTCDEHGRLAGGSDLLATLIVLEGMGISAFGLASGNNPWDMVEQLERIAPYATIPLIARFCITNEADRGEDREKNGEEGVPPLTAFDLTQLVGKLIPLGVTHFGLWQDATAEHMGGLKEGIAQFSTLSKSPFSTDPDVIPCASETEARFITPDIEVGQPLECTPDLLEDIVWAEEESPQGAVKIAIYEEDDIDLLAETQYAIRDPLCIETDLPQLLEGALRIFQGRAFWDGTQEIEDEFLAKMQKKYGLIVL